jgi:hypothetical protein
MWLPFEILHGGRKSSITKVVVENNGVWHTNLVAPNTLLGIWVLEVE